MSYFKTNITFGGPALSGKLSLGELEVVAESSFQKAREFFKNGIKSSNKVYPRADVEPESASEKQMRRRKKASLCDNLYLKNFEKASAAEIGKTIIENGITWANCGSMNNVFAYFLKKQTHGEENIAVLNIECVTTDDHLTDHQLVMIGDGLPNSVKSLEKFEAVGKSHRSVACDLWFKIQCHPTKYVEKISSKAQKWVDYDEKYIKVNRANRGLSCWFMSPVDFCNSIVKKDFCLS